MPRSLIHIPRRVVRTVVLTVLLGIVFFFAVTRTEVGRDELRQELQRQFDDRFAGTLRIGHLQGNLVNDLFATDVRLLDPSGRTVATIDSLVARPRWQTLFSRQLAFRSLTLFRPRLALHHDADSTWNVQQALRRHAPPDTTGGSPDLALADLRIRDGTVVTTRDSVAPPLVERDWLFDYAQTHLENLQANVTIEWSDDSRLIDVFELSGVLTEQDVRIEQLQGQLLGNEDRWIFNRIHLATAATDLTFDAALPRPNAPPQAEASPEVELDLASSRVNFDELHRLLPRLPLADAATVAARIRGPLSGLVIETASVERETSRLALEGTILGLPDRADFELSVHDSRLTARDVRALAPSLSLPPLDALETVHLTLYSKGLLPFDSDSLNLQATTELAVASPTAGAVEGTLQVTQRPNEPLDYDGRFAADSLNLAPLTRSPTHASRLSGTVNVTGRGLDPTSVEGRIELALTPSSLAGGRVDSLHAYLYADAGLFRTDLELWHPENGYVYAEGDLDLLQVDPSYFLSASAHDLNVQTLPLLTRLPATRLNGNIITRGTGFSLAEMTGRLTVDLDSSAVHYDDRIYPIPPHRSELTLADHASEAPRLELTGDVATLRLTGDVAFEPLWALGNLWVRSLRDAAHQEFDKPYHPPFVAASEEGVPSGPFPLDLTASPAPRADATEEWQARTRRALDEAGFADDLTVEGTFGVKRSDVLEALLPVFPTLRTDLNGRITVTAGAERFALQSHLQGNTFAVAGLSTDSLAVRLHATGNLNAPLAETFTSEITVRSAHARLGSLALRTPQLTLDYSRRQALFWFESEKNENTGPFRLAATTDLLPDRNEITVYDVHFAADDYGWTSAQPSTLFAYADALVVPDLRLSSSHPDPDRMQRFRVHGTFSSSTRDTLYAEAHNVLLQPFSDLARFTRPIGGVLDGTVALTGGWETPQTHGNVTVDWLSLDRRLLGRLRLASRYEIGAPDLYLDATLHSVADASDAPSYLPYRPRRDEQNHLALEGRIRLTEATGSPPASAPPSDQIDLALDVQRADLFFFEYIFSEQVENVSGYLTGQGAIRGSFRHPRFSADLHATDGYFELPQFNLHYDLDGPISVDDEGIHLNEVAVYGPDDGTAVVRGDVLFNRYEYFSFDLHAELDEMRIIDVARAHDLPFYGQIAASGPVTLTGPLSGATLRAPDARTTPNSELYIPIKESEVDSDSGFIIFADSTGRIPDIQRILRRSNILADRPEGEPSFLDALDLDINLRAPQGSTVHLVFDPLLGDVVTAVGAGRVQIQRQEGEFFTYGTFEVNSGAYLFTAGEVFVRRFSIDGGTIIWDGNPTNAQLDLDASYRTRASTDGLPGRRQQRIPVVVQLDITGRVESPRVGLNLAVDSRDRGGAFASETLQGLFNQPDLVPDDLATEYATSVLLTNTFLLTTSSITNRQQAGSDASGRLTDAGNRLAFNSVSQLVASQLNRYLNETLPNLDVSLGVQGEDPQDLDVIYGVALRLLDERLIIRGEGIYQGDETERQRNEGLEGEFVVEVRLSSNISVEAFYRRAGDEVYQTLTSTTGAGLSYQTEFTTWRDFFRRLFGWLLPDDERPADTPPDDAPDLVPPDTLATEPKRAEF